MKRKTIQVTIIFFVSTLIQVISNIVLTRLFGISIEYSHFLAAVTLPTIFVTVIYGTLNDALLPLYGEKIIVEKEKSEDFFFSQLTSLTLFSILITLILNLFAPLLMNQFFGNSDLFQSTLVMMFTVLTLAIPFATIVTILGMRFYAHKQYARFPVAQMIGSLTNLILVLLLYKYYGAWGLVYSFVINIAVQILFVLPGKFKFKIGHIIPTLSLWAPLIIGIMALKSDSLIVRTFSAQLPEGFIVYHNLISKLCSLSAGIITIGIQILFLPNIIERLANKDFAKVKEMVNKVKLIAIGLSSALVLGIYFVAPFFIKILFVGGKFSISDFNTAITLIPYYLLPVFGWGIISVFLQPLYALKKHLHVGILILICFLLAWFVASTISKDSPTLAISVGLSILLLGSSIGSEILWRINFNKLSKNS